MRTPKGYTARRGDYDHGNRQMPHGDDCGDRWYIDAHGEPIDHRGPGYATRREAVWALVDRLDDVQRSFADTLRWHR